MALLHLEGVGLRVESKTPGTRAARPPRTGPCRPRRARIAPASRPRRARLGGFVVDELQDLAVHLVQLLADLLHLCLHPWSLRWRRLEVSRDLRPNGGTWRNLQSSWNIHVARNRGSYHHPFKCDFPTFTIPIAVEDHHNLKRWNG